MPMAFRASSAAAGRILQVRDLRDQQRVEDAHARILVAVAALGCELAGGEGQHPDEEEYGDSCAWQWYDPTAGGFQ